MQPDFQRSTFFSHSYQLSNFPCLGITLALVSTTLSLCFKAVLHESQVNLFGTDGFECNLNFNGSLKVVTRRPSLVTIFTLVLIFILISSRESSDPTKDMLMPCLVSLYQLFLNLILILPWYHQLGHFIVTRFRGSTTLTLS